MINLYEVYRHMKRGSQYYIAGVATAAIANNEVIKDGDEVAVYRDLNTFKLYVRKASQFEDGRFEKVEL